MNPFFAMLLLCGVLAAGPAVDSGRLDTVPALPTPEELRREAGIGLEKTEHWFGVERRNLLIMAGGIAGSAAAGAALTLIVGFFAERRRRRHRFTVPVRILDALARPGGLLLALTGGFLFLQPVLNALPEKPHPWDFRLYFTLVTLLVVYALFNLVGVLDDAVRRAAEKSGNRLDSLLMKIVRKTLKITILLLASLFIGQSIFALNITTLLAGAGVVGLAVALAARDTLSNFFGTIVILADRPFRIGDRIKVDEIDGVVEDVGMRSCRIRTFDESSFTIPNSIMVGKPVENISRHGLLRYAFTLTLTYDTTAEQLENAIGIVHDITDHFHGPDLPAARPRVFLSQLADWSINLKVIMWLKTIDFQQEETWKTELHLALLRRFSAAGLNWAFPSSTSYVATAPELTVRLAAAPPAAGGAAVQRG